MALAPPRPHAMKKVVCPACGLVNLEKFVTYPHCAACGAPLADAPDEKLPLWKRPLSAPLWATVLGLCCAGLGVAGILATRETRLPEDKQLVVYVQTPRHLRVGQVGQVQLGLDSVEEEGASGDLNDLQLRLPSSLLRDFVVASIAPMPRGQFQRRNGIYFDFGDVKRSQIILISLRARRAGTRRIAFSLYARDFPRLQWGGALQISPRTGPSPLANGGRMMPRATPGATRQTGR